MTSHCVTTNNHGARRASAKFVCLSGRFAECPLLLWAAENCDYAKTLVDGTPAFQVDFIIIIIIIIIIIYYELVLDRTVSALSNSLFKGLLSCLRPFGLQFSIIFGILLFILVKFRSQFDLYHLSFSSTGSTFNSRNFFIPSVRKNVPGYSSATFITTDVISFLSIFLRVQISLPHTRTGIASALYTFILENFWSKVCLKVLLEFASFIEYIFEVPRKFHNQNI